MSSTIVKDVAERAADAQRASTRRAVISHVTHYVLGLGAGAAAATAGVLAAVGASNVLAAVAGGVGALAASVQTFMSPQKRAAFHYELSAAYEKLALDARTLDAGSPGDAVIERLTARLHDLRQRTAKDLSG